jgi:hypothetical protein
MGDFEETDFGQKGAKYEAKARPMSMIAII